MPRVGFFVADISLDDIEEIYPIRAALISLTVKNIIEKGYEPAFIERLEDYLIEMGKRVQEGDVKRYFSLSVQLYNCYFDNCHNSRLSAMVDQLGKQVLRFRLLGMTPPGRLQRSYELNKALLTAIKDRDRLSAFEIVEKIIYDALAAMRPLLESK